MNVLTPAQPPSDLVLGVGCTRRHAAAYVLFLALGALASWLPAAHAQAAQAADAAATFSTKSLTTETALRAAQAALASCRKSGFQIAVAVVDRGGTTQVVLRDRFAGAHTPDTAVNKAWTAVTFKQSTLQLAKETEPGKEASGIRHLPRVVAVGGGMMIEAGGSLIGGIGISGAPGGVADHVCAEAGVKAISADIEF
jgi:uncharacterized protein GlcG (DUF336 family)